MPLIKMAAERQKRQVPPGMQPPENAADWFRIQNSADDSDSTDVFVYDSIGGWFGLYADEFIEQLNEVTTSKINLRLNSPGGSVFEGIAVANALRSHPAHVTVYVDSLAASIASVIMLAGDRVVMQPQSQVMIHAASGACYGDSTEMTKMADLLDFQTRNIADAYAERTGRPVSEFLDLMAAETWLSAKEAVEIGLADEAMPMRPKKGEQAEDPASVAASMHRSWDLSMYRYAGRENAPVPTAKQAVTPGMKITAEMVSGLQTVSDTTVPVEQTQTITLRDQLSESFVAQFKSLVREAIRDELTVIEGTAVGSHSTAVKDGTWDAGSNEGRLPSPVPLATVRKMYTYYDEDKVEDGGVPKSACKLPHHFVGSDGTPGAASVNGVRNALARLPQTQGLSDAERSAAEAHLRKHLAAFNGGEDALDTDDAMAPDEEVVDAGKKKLPPFLQPDEDEDEDEEKEADDESDSDPEATTGTDQAPAEHPTDTGLGNTEETVEDTETYDDWNQFVAHLAESSPSADDVFNAFKEAL